MSSAAALRAPNRGSFFNPGYVPTMARYRAASTLDHLPAAVETLVRFEVVNRRGRVLADFTADRGPDGCGVVTRVSRRFGSLAPVMGHAGALGAPAVVPPRILIGLARRQADLWHRAYAPTASIRRVAG